MMNNEDLASLDIEAILSEQSKMPWREAVLETFIRLGLRWEDVPELRITHPSDDPAILAQRVANLFVSTLYLYPTALAVHPAVKALLEHRETCIKARHCSPTCFSLLGEGFTAGIIPIIEDESLDTLTVAARFVLHKPDYEQEMLNVLVRYMYEVRTKRKPMPPI